MTSPWDLRRAGGGRLVVAGGGGCLPLKEGEGEKPLMGGGKGGKKAAERQDPLQQARAGGLLNRLLPRPVGLSCPSLVPFRRTERSAFPRTRAQGSDACNKRLWPWPSVATSSRCPTSLFTSAFGSPP